MKDHRNVPDQLWKGLWSAPLLAIGGFTMSGAGLALGLSSGSWEKVIGSILVATGGIVLANPIVTSHAKEEALEDTRKRLMTASQLIATLSGQLDSALDEHEAGVMDNETMRRVVLNSLQTLTTASSQIQEIIGTRLDSGALLQTARDFREVQGAFEKVKSQAIKSGNPLAVEAIADAQTMISDAASRLGNLTENESLSVSCPYCFVSNEVEIGKAPGSSIIFCCRECLQRFHVHRSFNGRVDVRQRASIAEVQCTNCGDVHGIKLKPESATPISRWCLKCFVKQRIDPVNGIVTSFVPDTPLDVQQLFADGTGRSICQCPDCKTQLRAFAIRDGYIFAACYKCDNLLRMKEPEVANN
jgi:hypothetical protein